MNRHQLWVVLLCLTAMKNFAQYDNNWYFGRWAGLSFSTGAPVVLTNSVMSPVEACSSASDSSGNLMFYTNGASVWNRNGVRMQGDMLGDHSSSQGAIIIPRPGQAGHHYVFTADDAGGVNGLHYSEIDMALNGGLGGFANLNTPLITPVCEKITACYHANGTDIWITTHHWGSNAFYSYLVTAAGVNPEPVISHAGASVEGANNSGRYAGYMDISPDGTKLAIANLGISIQLFTFNNASGAVSNAVTLHSGECYGVAFSPDSSKLYVTLNKKLYQYDTAVDNVFNSRAFITDLEANGALRLAPDGKIYVINKLLSTTMSVISNPDAGAAACGFGLNSIDLGGRQTFAGLPALFTSPLYILSLSAAQDCSGAVSFSAGTTVAPDSIVWDFGDGTSSTEANPVHNYTTPGTYTVKVTAKKGVFMRYFTRTVTITAAQLPVANQPADLTQCDNDAAAEFNLRLQDAAILGAQPAGEYAVTYHASAGEAEAGVGALPDIFNATAPSTTIYARVTNRATQCHAVTSFLLIVWPAPVIDMPGGALVCIGETLTLTAPAGFDAYEWSTGETTRSITVNMPGSYSVTVFEDHNGQLCTASHTIAVIQSGAPVIRNIKVEDWTDYNNSISIFTEGTGNFEYSIDNINWQESNRFDDLRPGVYTVYVRDKGGCGFVHKEVAVLMFPRYFTPNADGHHDAWQVKFAYFEPGLLVNIFDRYGKVVASFKGDDFGWDGKFNGRDLPSTDYWFVAVRQDGTEHKGHFAMLR